MKQQRALKIGMVFLLLLLVLPFVTSATRSNPQYTQFMVGQANEFDESMCQQGQDFIIQIPPFGCTPAVVRSDLLEEQNVPVFCQLGATKINPLIDVEAIESISFSGEYPPEVEGIAFHPARAALGIGGDLTNPFLNNIGYVVIVLKKQENTSAMPDYVSGDLVAKMKYDVKNSFGIGKANFYLPEMTENEWEKVKYQYDFWSGKGTLRAESIGGDEAVISVYSGKNKISSVSLKKGEESGNIYLPGFDCLASLQVKLNGLENPDTRALLRINADVVEVAKGEKFLENKCTVASLEKQGLVQKVKIKCREDTGVNSFNLMISPKVRLDINGVEEEKGLGDFLYKTEDERKSVYLAYIGTKGESRDVNDLFVFLVSMPEHKSSLSESELARYNNLVGELLTEDFTRSGVVNSASEGIGKFAGALNLLFNFVARGEGFHWINYGDEPGQAFERSVAVNGFADPQDIILEENIQEYYELAVNDYETIGESFVGEKRFDNQKQSLDEEALLRQIILADDARQKATVVELCGEFKHLYPDSINNIKQCDDDYKFSNQEISVGYVKINGNLKKITFDGIYEPSIKDYGVKIFVSNAEEDYNGEKTLRKNKNVYLSDNESIFLKELEENYAIFDVSDVDYGLLKELTYDPKNLRIELNEYEVVGKNNYKISLEGINLKKFARVSVSPGIKDSGTEADFGFKIGIEQRAFELSPDKIKNKIEELDAELIKWQGFSEKLGKVVKGLKLACLVTGTTLTIKNFLANVGGKGIARKNIMRGDGGWYEKCAEMVSNDEYISQEECLFKKADDIDAEVDTVTKIMEEQNEKNKVLRENSENNDEFMSEFSENVRSYWGDDYLDSFEDPDENGEPISKTEMIEILSDKGWEDRNYDAEHLREIELWANVLEDDKASPDLKNMAEKRLYSVLSDVKINAGNFVERTNFATETGMGDSSLVASFRDVNEIPITERMKFSKTNYTSNQINDEDYVFSFKESSSGDKYLLVYDEDGSVDNTYIIEDNGDVVKMEEKNPLDFVFKKYDKSSYENSYKNAEVSFYETEPYKGLPAIVPFDLKNGWYAATKQTLPVLGNIASYDKSGAANSLWLCNVGENNLEENIGGDDDCAMMTQGTRQDQFPGLSEQEASKLWRCASDAISDASRHKSGNMVSIRTNCGGSIRVKIGKPAVDIPEIKCEDLMSPKDCQLLFNVCDPVICPSSRCDLGGAFPVRDVVQSGIIGSLLLCLPNAREGILIPVCLTGVQAGIDGWISVKKSYKDCLQHALDTGEMVGICDEIYSIYICEFFWRQALPFADLAIPKIISVLMGQSGRGGGEYLSVENAWETAGNSFTYFTQYYGENAFRAFRLRTSEEVGTEICKLSISAVYANGANIIDTLTEPDSPSQFHGRFDEIPFSSVTVPPTSHYKVFYHIFAGKDSGVYYKVYLKGISESSYYQDASSTLIIDSGYLKTGEYASETRDLTAISGYKQLCISVNAQEECGFKEVSTSFAVDYISDQYVASQVQETDIKTEKECISGSASVYSLLNPSVQGAAEEIANPAIYNRGIIRMCSTRNPGEGSDSYVGTENSRWKEVGYCGNRNMKCWIDTENIKNIIEGTGIAEDTLENMTQSYMDILMNSEGYIDSEEFKSKVKNINDEGNIPERLTLIEEIFDKVFWNSEKGYLYLLRGNAYAGLIIGEKVIEEEVEEEVEEKEEEKECYGISDCDPGYFCNKEFECEEECFGDSDCEEDYFCNDEFECEEEEPKAEVEEKEDEVPGYVERYEEVQELFERYSKDNLPDGWKLNKFKSLLVSIAIRQSDLGYADGEYDASWIMEFGERNPKYEGAENQIRYASSILKSALNKAGIINYEVCNNKFDLIWLFPNNHLICVLSVYYTGEESDDGEYFAEETIEIMKSVEEYFEKDSPIITIEEVKDIKEEAEDGVKEEEKYINSVGDTVVVHYSISWGDDDKEAAELLVSALEDKEYGVSLKVAGELGDNNPTGDWTDVESYDKIIIIGGPWPNKLNKDYCNCFGEEGEVFVQEKNVKDKLVYFIAGYSRQDTLDSVKNFIENQIEEGNSEVPSSGEAAELLVN
jgi:hypothetical protein